ncbi:DHA2 family efflux MFS transporter permease subunit [Mycolicibacterium rufum]|uniref:DHA2 family efflux MFS transporter permease subunit n=1 Tax=Mycolicibacterium rufum TaxID=318424 RepID=A0A9X2Y071_9MYCO|nr:DHA2 family efflux MFS transporter permease subunit [Mycolicibacterium rufum]MCV7071672.1 DHA2 family efflux MFS transporter permease subunit [Mycolicibacterium rufum]ULP36794.1 DHA2 family efflux MFS transporter permease subunit [Mycolicibacterium rufum]
MAHRVEPAVEGDRLDARLLRIAGVCVLAAIMTILDTTVVNVAQRTFIAEFGSSQAVVAWTATGYTLALAAVIPMTGWAADRFGTKRLFLGSVVLFTAGSLLCATASDITELIVYRVIQGLGGGMLMPLVFTILTREAGPRRLGRLMSVLGIPMLLGPVAGPVLGGWLIDDYGWRWIFLINVPIGVLALVLAALIFARDEPSDAEPFDVIGMLLLSPGLASLLYGVSSLPEHTSVTDAHVWIPTGGGVLLVAAFVVHALHKTAHPLIDLRLFRNRLMAVANAAMLVFAAAFFGAILLLPSYFQQVLHLTPFQSGLHVIPQGLGAMVTMPLAGRLVDRQGPGKIVLTGITLMVAGMGVFAYGAWHQDAYVPVLVTGLVVFGFGMGATMMPLSSAAVQTLRPEQIARGSTLINVNQRVAGSIGTAVMSVILTHQVNRSDAVSTANQVAALQEQAHAAGRPLDPATLPPAAAQPGFADQVMHDLSHAYTMVFLVAALLIAAAYLPAALLPRTRVEVERP